MTKLALDHPKRMLNFGPNARFELFNGIKQCAFSRAFIQRLSLAGPYGHMPKHFRLGVWPLLYALVACIGKDHTFFSMQQTVAFVNVVHLA